MADYAEAWEKWFPVIEDGASKLTARMLDGAGLKPGQRVLDIATGIGEPALTAAQRIGSTGRVIGIDLSSAMLEFAGRRALEAGQDNVEFRIMDANALDFDDASFDAVLCRWGLMFVDDLESTLGAIHAVLKPHGRLAMGVWANADQVPALATAARVFHRELGLLPPPEGAGTAFALADGPALIAALEHSGYEAVDWQPVNIRYHYVSTDEYFEHRREVSSLFRQSLEGLSDSEFTRARHVLDNELQAVSAADGSLAFDNRAYCVTATRA